jgi:hypothetical protein
MAFPQTDYEDIEGGDEPIKLANEAALRVHASDVFRFDLRGGTRVCDVARRGYIIVFGGARLSPALYMNPDGMTPTASGAARSSSVKHAADEVVATVVERGGDVPAQLCGR